MGELKVRRFANKEAQNTKVNRFLAIGMTVFYLVVIINVYTSYMAVVRTAGYMGG